MEKHNLKYLWIIVPRAINECYKWGCEYIKRSEDFKVVFVLNKLVKGKETLDTIYRVLLDSEYKYYLDARTILFIPTDKIKVTICVQKDGVEKCPREFTKIESQIQQTIIQNGERVIVELREKLNEKENVEKWFVMSKKVMVPEEVRRDPTTAVFKRENVVKRLIAIAFRLEDDKLKPIKGIVKFSVFSYMPLREAESGLNYLLHAT